MHERLAVPQAPIEPILAHMRLQHAHGQEGCPAQEEQGMTEQYQGRTLLATLRDALHEMGAELERVREGIDAIDAQATRLRESLAALGALRQDEIAAVGIDMVIDAVTELLQACNNLESALPDAQEDVETLAAEMEDDEDA
jgi:hypothetical protein